MLMKKWMGWCGILALIGGGSCQTGNGSAVKKQQSALPAGSGAAVQRVVVQEFKLVGDPGLPVAAVTGKFCVELSKCERIELICPDDIKNLMEYEKGLKLLGACDNDQCLSDFGKMAKARYVIYAKIEQGEEMIGIMVNLLDIDGNKPLARYSRQVDNERPEDLLLEATKLAQEIAKKF